MAWHCRSWESAISGTSSIRSFGLARGSTFFGGTAAERRPYWSQSIFSGAGGRSGPCIRIMQSGSNRQPWPFVVESVSAAGIQSSAYRLGEMDVRSSSMGPAANRVVSLSRRFPFSWRNPLAAGCWVDRRNAAASHSIEECFTWNTLMSICGGAFLGRWIKGMPPYAYNRPKWLRAGRRSWLNAV